MPEFTNKTVKSLKAGKQIIQLLNHIEYLMEMMGLTARDSRQCDLS